MKRCFEFIMLLCLIFVLFSGCKQKTLFDAGKDTVTKFGDGTYQILHQVKNEKNVEILTNCKYNQCVLTSIDKYCKKDNDIYFIGEYYGANVMCVLMIKDNTLRYFLSPTDDFVMVYGYDMQKNGELVMLNSVDEFSAEDKRVFQEMSGKNIDME